MKKAPSISVAMTTFNGGKHIAQQLESLNKQSLRPSELIICDDISTDNTIEIIETFSKTSSFPVKLYRNESNLKSTQNFAKAINLCRGEISFLCDQDDLWYPNKVEMMAHNFIKNDKIAMMMCNADLIDDNNVNLGTDIFFTFNFDQKYLDLFKSPENLTKVLNLPTAAIGAAMASVGFSYVLKAFMPQLPFMDRMGIVFLAALTIAVVLSFALPANVNSDRITTTGVSYRTTAGFNVASGAVIAILVALYATWW